MPAEQSTESTWGAAGRTRPVSALANANPRIHAEGILLKKIKIQSVNPLRRDSGTYDVFCLFDFKTVSEGLLCAWCARAQAG